MCGENHEGLYKLKEEAGLLFGDEFDPSVYSCRSARPGVQCIDHAGMHKASSQSKETQHLAVLKLRTHLAESGQVRKLSIRSWMSERKK